MRSIRFLRIFILLAAFAGVAFAAEKPVNTSLLGVAIKGYDPVAYFKDSRPVEGESRFTVEWIGAKWRFSSAENSALFKANPEKYAPQFGGYCASAVSRGYTASIDPASWKIVEGKLYLNYSSKVQAMWAEDLPGNISKAEANWPKLIGK